jgi:hypothetical protein
MALRDVIGRFFRTRFGAKLRFGAGASARDIFRDIYRSNYWGNEDSRSGAGSDLAQTAEVRLHLPRLINELGIRRMLDIPCGDWHWMREVHLDVDYIGADIVPEIVERNQQLYGGEGRRFVVLDVVSDDLPCVDLVFARDLLVHLSFDDVRAALRNLVGSGSTYLLTTTFTGRASNPDIRTGHWRPLNLVKPPFGFPEPLQLINEKCTEGDGSWGDKSLGLWRLSDIAACL